MPAQPGHQPPRKRAAQREGARVAKSASSTQPIGKRKPKAKAKPEIEPAKRIVGVGANAKPVVLDASEVTLTALEVGNGGAVIRVSEKPAASLHKLGDPSL